MIEVFFAVIVACTADPSGLSDCGSMTSPVWYLEETECVFSSMQAGQNILNEGGEVYDIQCISVNLPVSLGEPA